MLRMMIAAVLCLTSMALASCARSPHLDLCKHAVVRRQVYTTAIAAADVATASGRALPASVTLGREAASTALAVLNVNCPAQDGR